MKLQAAIDRVTLEQAKDLARQLDPIVDIIEMGTSLIKDYGFYALNKEALGLQHAELLLDAKTIDEGQYEFEKGFETGADILTVMGAASQGTLETTYKVAERYGRQMFIDLMEVNDQKLAAIDQFENAIYGLHHAKDDTGAFDAADSVASFHQKYPQIKRISTDLPVPDPPTTPMISPERTSRSSPSWITASPNWLRRPRMRIA